MCKSFFLLSTIFLSTLSFSQNDFNYTDSATREASFADYDAFKTLVNTVEKHRAERMISLEEMNKMSKKPNTIILDTRSKAMYDAKHVKGAIHLNFADFTQATLTNILPDRETTIIIYCNNNFMDDQIFFATKSFTPPPVYSAQPLGITMALNIPTYINLYGYGYRNIYELKDLVSVYDKAITFEGTSVAPN